MCILPAFYLKIWLSEFKRRRTKNKNTGKNFSNGRSYQWNLKEEPKRFNLMCVLRLLIKISTVVALSTRLRKFISESKNNNIDSDSGRLTILKETARSQERLVLRATNTHQTISRWLLFAINYESSQTNGLYYLQFLIFVQLKFVWEKLKMQVTSASADFATTNSDRSTELIESFLLVYRYLDFDNG